VFDARLDSYNADMRLALKIHPDSISAATTGIEVNVTRPRSGFVALSYDVTGKIGDVRIPSRTEPIRADELWKQTCFEAFIRAPGSPGYYEFNISPSNQWAAYRFDGYRTAMCVATEFQALPITADLRTELYTLSAEVDLDRIKLPRQKKWQLGLSAVIEELNGRKSYWALAHPPGKPDFHHSDCFTYEFS
jgi:hypothetical protein